MSQPGTIVVEPSKPEDTAPQGDVKDTSAQAPSDPLSALTVPADLESVDAKYRGKSVKDVIEMHQHAERALGDQGREVGIWRNLVSELSTAAAAKPAISATTPKEEPLNITADSLLQDPVGAMTKIAERAIAKSVAPLKHNQEMNARELEMAGIAREFPKIQEWGNDPAFQKWAWGSPGRAADAKASKEGDTQAMRRLLENWSDRVSLTAAPAAAPETTTVDAGKPQGVAGARAATTERGSAGGGGGGAKKYRTTDLVNMINTNPDQWRSESFQAEIKQAMKEGRVID